MQTGHYKFLSSLLCCVALLYAAEGVTESVDQPHKNLLPKKLQCRADQTAGLHDYAGAPQEYEASTFFESKFQLRVNTVLTKHLATDQPTGSAPDLFLTLFPRNDKPVELGCRQVQGHNRQLGYSCTNTPPSEILLINPSNLRFTRASIGGWTFTDPRSDPDPDSDPEKTPVENGGDESLFVEYGICSRP